MNKNDLLNNFRGLAGELMESIRGKEQDAPIKKTAAKSAAAKAAAPKKPMDPRVMQKLIRHGIVLLLVIVCCFSVIFASCAKAKSAPADGSSAPVESSVSPAL